MSENIQSISQGTYTIGQTSATNFVAGPGIKIDEPSAGTVRIGNDETVLYSGALTSNASLSEPLSSFETIKVHYASDFTETSNDHIVAEIDASKGSHYWVPVAGLGVQNAWISMNLFSASNDYTSLSSLKSKLINFGKYNVTGTALAGATTGENQAIIYKVVGINRISGSNA